MSEIFRIKGNVPIGLNVRNKITRINYEPKMYWYDETRGLCIKWRVRDVRIISKIIEGPFKQKCKENGKIRRKQRYYVVTFPEMVYEPTADILELIEANETNEKFRSLVHMQPPPIDVLEQMETKAAELHYKRKAKNGDAKTMFKVGELGEETLSPIEGTVFKCSSKLWKRSVSKMPKSFRDATVAAFNCCSSSPSDKADVKKCMKVIERTKDWFYIAEYWPWCLLDADLKKPFWKLMHKALGYKKLTISTLTCDLDMEDYGKLKKMREEEFLEVQDMADMFTPIARGL